jgi:hypothetical protein
MFGRKHVTKPDRASASYDASLVSLLAACESASPFTVTHRYEEHIAGRTYQIEVLPVSDARWRAQIVRLPGMPASMMPFYGATPEQAAQELGRWLALVYNGSGGWSGPRTV